MRFLPRAGFPDGYARLDRHLDRLAASARYFGWADPTAAAVAALRREAALVALEPQRRRVRLVAHADGRVTVAGALLPGDVSRVRTAALARTPVDRADPMLRHSTTDRAVHDARRAEWPHADDVLLRNAEGDLVGFTEGALVAELAGDGGARRWTPPFESGAAAGVFRGELLDRGLVAERVLRPAELAGARVWLVSSLREWVPIEIVERL